MKSEDMKDSLGWPKEKFFKLFNLHVNPVDPN
jgi:hypothetical protein